MNYKIILMGALGMLLSSCAGDGTIPEDFAGTWGADCAKPVLRVGSGSPEYFEAAMFVGGRIDRFRTSAEHWNGNYLTLTTKDLLEVRTYTFQFDHDTQSFVFKGWTYPNAGPYGGSDDLLKKCA